ncbi:NAD-dependent epimerase/dehydratase family protein [Halopelagius longus]|uniref:CDP-paratose 2-epimerase n=1 Tax=Halopelagius longus TaxID=1236180 RepID=A0A1H1API4_9EURY|nr:NAD-dependent epimerase/dehydratase family protein [Halopelagius longus]RDI70449.1 NAD-dependent epimerase/dehydratase family protein [Halopelagius longus]SDQ41076.1 CDP-paratose 2-epimerase [Halopelagius longus]
MEGPDRVLVTGGAGFVGSHAVEYYANRDAEVTALDNLSRIETLETADESRNTAAYNWNYIEENYPEVELVEADIRDYETLAEIVEGHDAVVHTAGQVAVTASLTDPRNDFEVNAEGSFNVLEAARNADSDPAVVLASTNKVYGNNVNDIPVREEGDRYWYDDEEFEQGVPESLSIDGCEHTPYGVSKLAADLYVQDYAERNAVQAAAFRMSCIYGTRQFGNEDQGWVAHFAISTLNDEPLTIFGDGKQVRDVLYVKDLIRAYDAFLSDPEGKPAVYNVGGGAENTTSLLEFLDLLEEKTGKRTDISFDEWREGDQKVYVSDISRAREELEWEPEVSFEDGVERFVEWYQNR